MEFLRQVFKFHEPRSLGEFMFLTFQKKTLQIYQNEHPRRIYKSDSKLSNEKRAPGCLGYIGGCNTLRYGVYYIPL